MNKGGTDIRGLEVDVYRNLNRKDCFSVRACEGPRKGRVIAYVRAAQVLDAEFRVSETSRQRVLARRCRSVHAVVRGTLGWYVGESETHASPAPPEPLSDRVSYNPYRSGHFYRCDTGRPVGLSNEVVLTQCCAWVEPEAAGSGR